MARWVPVELFPTADVFIVGGGPSLKHFDWSLLRGKNVIGCNSAYKLGVDICPVTFFSDKKFFDAFGDELRAYSEVGGQVFTHCVALAEFQNARYIKVLSRTHAGLHTDEIGFGGNSGCSAVNLAFILGARRVFLLGFDCKPPTGEAHWHNYYDGQQGSAWSLKDALFPKFMEGWKAIYRDLPNVFPGREIINLGPDSAIPFFPIHTFSQYLDA